MKNYKYLFFDLDRTLWDYDANASEALQEIYESKNLKDVCGTFQSFYTTFTLHNDNLWEDYREGRIQKDSLRVRRFELLLKDFGLDNKKLAEELNEYFLNSSPYKSRLVPGSIEVLGYLTNKGYKLYILTNGFTHIQTVKMQSSGLNIYFEKVFTCENTCSFKPRSDMFAHALNSVHARKKESIMIGDDLQVDIVGARNFGIDQIFFNPSNIPHQEKVTFEIKTLTEIISIL